MGSPPKVIKKSSLIMRHHLEQKGIDLVELQMQVFKKAMDAFDNQRGYGEKSDAGPHYLAVCNTAIATLAKYAFPSMTAIKLEEADKSVNEKIINATEVRNTILKDPFAKNAVNAITNDPELMGLPVLSKGANDGK